MECVNSMRISAPPWWPLREGRDGKCEGRNEKCETLARESENSSPIMQSFGEGKRKFTANFSATVVTSLPSLSLSLCLSVSLSHRKYLTHNIGSASALPIIQRETDRRDVTIVALKLAMSLHFPCQKNSHNCYEFTLSLAKNSPLSFLLSLFPSLLFKWSPLLG